MRRYSPIDHLINHFDTYLKIFSSPSANPYLAMLPNTNSQENDDCLSIADKKLITSMLRVNHCGEVCAQALYQSQALFAKDLSIQDKLQQAAAEEVKHLSWCQARLNELKGRPSYLAPIFGLGSFFIGSIFALAGDKWNLGFLAETERQVAQHLDSQLEKLPRRDKRTQNILQQMRLDELNHVNTAEDRGAASLPNSIKFLMQSCAQVMITTTKHI